MSQYKNLLPENNEKYYGSADAVSENFAEFPGVPQIISAFRSAKTILEIGCGNGVKISQIVQEGQEASGCDINSFAIEQAQKRYPHIRFFMGNSEALDIESNSYDAICHFYMLEHVDNQAAVMSESLRVLKPGGTLAMICPNFASPFFPAPPVRYNKKGLAKVWLYLGRIVFALAHPSMHKKVDIDFEKITPITTVFETDYDTVCAPSLQNIVEFFTHRGDEIVYANSLWSSKKIYTFKDLVYLPFRLCSFLPFLKWWGPLVCVIVRKSGK